MGRMVEEYHTSAVIRRYRGGVPVLTKEDMPFEAQCIFNAGVVKFQGKYVMAFRNDYGYRGGDLFAHQETHLAFSDDGITWSVCREPFLTTEMLGDPDVTQIYDPRLIVIDGRCYVCFAVNTRHGVRGGIGVTEDLKHIRVLSLSLPDNRNLVLFPERIGGEFVRLERPFAAYSKGSDAFDIWISRSPDLRYWGGSRLLLGAEEVPFCNSKIGPAAPPLKTERGWLTTFHAVTRVQREGAFGWNSGWNKCYCAGLMLLDAEDPSRVIGMYREPLIAPETRWETEDGYRTNVIFPGGMILEEDGTVRIYYGASDTVECLATAQLEDLLALVCGGSV